MPPDTPKPPKSSSGLPSFLVAGQIRPVGSDLVDQASLLIVLVSDLRLHHAVSRTVSLRLPFRFGFGELTH